MTLHEDDRETYSQCEVIARETAKRFKIKLKTFEPKRHPIYKSMGICYYEQARIAIVFRYRVKTQAGQVWFSIPISISEVLDTVGHELAHLRYPNHGKRFWDLADKIVGYIIETYYDPFTLGFKVASAN